jgi:hypothetical protein
MGGVEMKVTLLYFDGCPLTPPVRRDVAQAVASLGKQAQFEQVNLSTLPPTDPRRGYGSPTVLVDGRDLFGLPPSVQCGLACRPYPGGLPTATRWADLLSAAAD